ncbi:MAG: hypothetical protein AB7I59_04255 [Geminicoccaceae bacterium]
MPTELSMVGAPLPGRPTGSLQAELRPATPVATAAMPVPAAARVTVQAAEPSQALDRASRWAARALFQDRDVEVTSFQDKDSGRIVYRIADRASGQVLHQSPPDALLRFFASTRQSLERPLMAVEV